MTYKADYNAEGYITQLRYAKNSILKASTLIAIKEDEKVAKIIIFYEKKMRKLISIFLF